MPWTLLERQGTRLQPRRVMTDGHGALVIVRGPMDDVVAHGGRL